MKNTVFVLSFVALSLCSCGKYDPGSSISHAFGGWGEIRLPDGCVAKQIAVESNNGVAVLCEDGRVFH